MVFLFTGLSGAGKTTLARRFKDELQQTGYRIELLDGDVSRRDLCCDLGFSKADRIENVRRLGEAARARLRAGTDLVLISAIAPYAASRAALRDRVPLCEVFVDCPLDVLVQRDPKGLYERALRGELEHFTGVSDPYERPDHPDIHLRTDRQSIDECIDACKEMLYAKRTVLSAIACRSRSPSATRRGVR
jgi:adenylylsulfate kinase